MPLHGKIVVIKRSGGDGTEFPLTASCLFGRKAECDIRIQLPSVSKEHCRIDLNENKEVILTNLSSANPTHINGKAFHQSERLKHGDIITVLDRSFRFEYPPAPTPKKTTSVGPKSETLKVLRHQQVSETITVEAGDKRQSEVSLGPHLKDGANIDNIQRSLEKTLEVESKEDGSPNKTNSPFSDLYQMIKKSLNVKTPRVSSASQVQTPSSRLCTPKSGSVLKKHDKSVTSAKKDETKLPAMPPLVKKQEKSVQDPSADETGPGMGEGECATKCEAASKSRRSSGTPQKFTVSEVLEQIPAQGFKSPIRRRSKESTPGKSPVSTEQEQPAVKSPNAENPRRTSPRTSGSTGKEVSKKRKSRELGSDSSGPKMKKKRVSFGGYLSPELFDKRLPPDSPLRKGATPRRSLTLRKSKLSLLRRASVIGFLKEKSPAKTKTPSPKKLSSASPKTSPGKKSPKSGSPSSKSSAASKKSPQSKSSPKAASPKPASPAQKSPKSRSSTPKAASPRSRATSPKAASPADKVKTPKAQRKSATPGQQARDATPDGKRRSSPGESTSAKTPSGVQTPTVQGRFSVSRISTPSPAADVDPVVQQEPVSSVTPRIQLKRKSMKSTSRKTALSGSAVKILQRKSGVSRASMKAIKTSWANIVKFGETKTQIVAPAKKAVPQKTVKKAVSKPQTPARKPEGHVSTGHADSPATIVVGRAHKRAAVHPTGAAPRVVTNTAVLKKDMKMDEDLTGVSEMFKTPANERKRKSLKRESSAANTPVAALGTSVIEPSVLKTPEEPGEMVVSPLSLASTVKSRRYNSEAVHRLLNGDQELSFTNDVPASNVQSESTEEQDVDFKTTCVTTPKQKPELPDGLTGVKRITKTPKEKAEPVEDLRGKLLKTPKQKPEQQECLTGVKRIMKTPREKAEPVEDIRGKLLITPKQKPEQQECLTGVRRIFKTPKQKAEPLEDLRGKLLKTPKARESGEVSLDGVKELVETPTQVQKSEFSDVKTPDIKSSVMVCLTDVRRAMNTPRQKYSPVEDMIGVKRLMRTPKQKGEPVEENFGIKKLMKSPRLRGVAPVEDFEGLQELMQEPPTYQTQIETNEVIMEIQPQEAAGEAQQQPKEETKLDTDRAIKKKPVRGRKAKTVEAETKEEAPEPSEDPVAAPVRGRRGRKLEAAAPPAVRQTRRTKSVKTEEKTSDQPAVECQATGGENAQAPLPVPSTVGKPKRGRRVKPDAEEQKDFTAEIKQQPQLPVRAKRGRNVQQKEGESDIDVKTTSQETSVCLEPVKKPRRTRKAEQDLVEPEVQVVEMHIPEKAEVPAAKPVTVSEATVAPKPRRGGRKAKTGAEAAAPVKSTEVIEVPDASNEKPKRSTRGKPTTQEVVATENPEQEPEEQKKTCSPPQIIRASRARGRKNEVSQAIPAKRALRGRAAPVEETSEEPVSEPTPVKPAKRGRWATAKSKAQMTTDYAKSTENVTEAAVEDPKKSKNVQFTSDVQIFEIPKATPVAVRGKKSKLENVSKDANKLEEENQKEKMAQAQPVRGKKSKLKNEKSENVSKDAKKPEEENLKEEITQAQPVRRGRRGVKAAGVPAESESQEGVKDAEAEPQPKTRRGRSAKK